MELTVNHLLYGDIIWNKEMCIIEKSGVQSEITRLEFQCEAIDGDYLVEEIKACYSSENEEAYLLIKCKDDKSRVHQNKPGIKELFSSGIVKDICNVLIETTEEQSVRESAELYITKIEENPEVCGIEAIYDIDSKKAYLVLTLEVDD